MAGTCHRVEMREICDGYFKGGFLWRGEILYARGAAGAGTRDTSASRSRVGVFTPIVDVREDPP